MKNFLNYFCLFFALCVIASTPTRSQSVESDGELNQQPAKESFTQRDTLPLEKKGNILNIVLDKPPAISTERGTLVIEAFLDLNKNQQRDDAETDLYDVITCTLDEIDYAIPAFIPALDYNARYKLSCQGTTEFQPTVNQKNVLIARRGEIIHMVIPCRSTSNSTENPPSTNQ